MGGRLGGLEDNDLPTRLRDMDVEGITTSVLFPSNSFRVSQTMEREYAISYCRAYNNFISDICKKNPRLKAVGLVPFQNMIYDAPAVVAEVNRAISELGLAGITVSCQGLKEHLGSVMYWPIYEELQRLGAPLCVHNRHAPPGEDIYDSLLFKHAVGRPIMTAVQFAGLMYGGVPGRVSQAECRLSGVRCRVAAVLGRATRRGVRKTRSRSAAAQGQTERVSQKRSLVLLYRA